MTSAKDSIGQFLGYGGQDHRQRSLDQALAWDDNMLETTHDYVQWWFPLSDPSAFSSDAPVASGAEFEELAGDPRVRAGQERAMHRMLRFYGLNLDATGTVSKFDEWSRFSLNWASTPTHNDLRITRMLKSLCLLGHRTHAEAIFSALEEIIEEERGERGQVPLSFWRSALLG